MADNHIAIETNGLSKKFGGRYVLDGVNIQVAQGWAVGLMGPNGSGKTTLLRCLATALRPSSGEVRWYGRRASEHQNLHRLLGFAGHDGCLYPALTVRENLTFAARMYGIANPADHVARWLDSTDLWFHADRAPSQISRGMRQRLSLARALLHRPPIILLDEPFSNLDAGAVQWSIDLLRQCCRRGAAVLFTTHNHQQARGLADRLLRLEDGRLRSAWPNLHVTDEDPRTGIRCA